ncbi:hypothetical protein GALMADRAFT_242305 [Galerina marginata CBS 339.88]|uniref:Uncharacterized protein n=1 Tax=Galerina marginata (strain CBS 339.88) TaxID=685588 RepID=A0A067TJI3_GALM3|nr:hypothetical protein GALMADRAFT_242305 [Galerina marginata CBS 339.88]
MIAFGHELDPTWPVSASTSVAQCSKSAVFFAKPAYSGPEASLRTFRVPENRRQQDPSQLHGPGLSPTMTAFSALYSCSLVLWGIACHRFDGLQNNLTSHFVRRDRVARHRLAHSITLYFGLAKFTSFFFSRTALAFVLIF